MEKNVDVEVLSKEQDIKQMLDELEWVHGFESELPLSGFERILRGFIKYPLVPIGCIATATVLGIGFRSFLKGDRKKSQLMMRWRVGLQGATLSVIVASILYETHRRKNPKN